MPQPHVVRAVLACLRERPDYPGYSMIDLSCGEGEILQALSDEGVAVRGTHFQTGDYIIEKPRPVLDQAPIDEGIDLTSRLPYEDATFDVVLMSEVVEHLPAHQMVFFEAGRILKPGGWLVLTTPNLQRLHSRWQFFWSGTHKLIRRRVGWDLSRDELYAYHINPLDLPLAHTLLFQAGLGIREIRTTMFKWRHAWLGLFWPFFWLGNKLAFRPHRREALEFRDGERDLARWMRHPATLFSEQLLVVAEKPLGS